MADKILLIIGLLVAVAIVVTGGFGLLRGDQLGFNFNFLTSGPRTSGPGWFGGSQEGVAPPAGVGQRETETPPPAPRPGYSPFEKRVRISNVSRPSDIDLKPDTEYVILTNSDYSDQASLAISNWTLENSQGKRYPIEGAATQLALEDVNESAVFLPPGGRIYIHTGPSPIAESFRENACTGYLNENHNFYPSLSSRCPRIDISKLVQFNDRCLNFLERSVSGCRIPQITGLETQGIGDDCSDFIVKHFNYRGCVDDFRAASDFFDNTWHLYLERSEKLWRSLHDLIILRDAQGLIVDTYQY